MVAHLVDARPGQRVLDLCSAPGGKTLLLARAVGPEGVVVATDVNEHRLRSVREQTHSHAHDERRHLLSWMRPSLLPFESSFSRILVDAPCSGTGTLARNPEIRWRLDPQNLAASADQQRILLRNALARWPPAEDWFMRRARSSRRRMKKSCATRLGLSAPFDLSPGANALAGHLRSGVPADALFDREGFFRTFPPESGTDGFFAAAIERST